MDGGQDVAAGGFDVGGSAGFDVAGPDGEPSGSHSARTFSPKSLVLPENQASMVSPFTLVVLMRHRSVLKILPSRMRWGTPAATARSSAWWRSGAWVDRTSMASCR
ncbi:hypothetical protein FLW53_37300 [Microbispora sp. SCL1-1]|nr:hypothetical protein FLW53_37300 [Microbispora sp. SCL1-1]